MITLAFWGIDRDIYQTVFMMLFGVPALIIGSLVLLTASVLPVAYFLRWFFTKVISRLP
jgi:hypothetical protein